MKSRLHRFAPCCALVVIALIATPAAAGPYTDALGMCLVRSSSPDDKTLLVRWMFSTMSLHPEVQSMVVISYDERDALHRDTADLFVRLIAESCDDEAKEAIRYEGTSAIEGAFSVLGEVATRELFTHPLVAEGLNEFAAHIDESRLQPVFEEVSPEPGAEPME